MTSPLLATSIASSPSKMTEALNEAYRWARIIHSILGAMVTSTALLRLGVNNGNGRRTHELSKRDSGIEDESNETDFFFQTSPQHPSKNTRPPSTITQERLELAVHGALAFLTDVTSCGFIDKDVVSDDLTFGDGECYLS